MAGIIWGNLRTRNNLLRMTQQGKINELIKLGLDANMLKGLSDESLNDIINQDDSIFDKDRRDFEKVVQELDKQCPDSILILKDINNNGGYIIKTSDIDTCLWGNQSGEYEVNLIDDNGLKLECSDDGTEKEFELYTIPEDIEKFTLCVDVLGVLESYAYVNNLDELTEDEIAKKIHDEIDLFSIIQEYSTINNIHDINSENSDRVTRGSLKTESYNRVGGEYLTEDGLLDKIKNKIDNFKGAAKKGIDVAKKEIELSKQMDRDINGGSSNIELTPSQALIGLVEYIKDRSKDSSRSTLKTANIDFKLGYFQFYIMHKNWTRAKVSYTAEDDDKNIETKEMTYRDLAITRGLKWYKAPDVRYSPLVIDTYKPFRESGKGLMVKVFNYEKKAKDFNYVPDIENLINNYVLVLGKDPEGKVDRNYDDTYDMKIPTLQELKDYYLASKNNSKPDNDIEDDDDDKSDDIVDNKNNKNSTGNKENKNTNDTPKGKEEVDKSAPKKLTLDAAIKIRNGYANQHKLSKDELDAIENIFLYMMDTGYITENYKVSKEDALDLYWVVKNNLTETYKRYLLVNKKYLLEGGPRSVVVSTAWNILSKTINNFKNKMDRLKRRKSATQSRMDTINSLRGNRYNNSKSFKGDDELEKSTSKTDTKKEKELITNSIKSNDVEIKISYNNKDYNVDKDSLIQAINKNKPSLLKADNFKLDKSNFDSTELKFFRNGKPVKDLSIKIKDIIKG